MVGVPSKKMSISSVKIMCVLCGNGTEGVGREGVV